MQVTKPEQFPVTKNMSSVYPEPIIHKKVDGITTYYGYCMYPNQSTAEAMFKIIKQVDADNAGDTITTFEYPNGSRGYDFIWDDRESLSYTR